MWLETYFNVDLYANNTREGNYSGKSGRKPIWFLNWQTDTDRAPGWWRGKKNALRKFSGD